MKQRTILTVLTLMASAFGVSLLGGCTTARIPVTDLEVPVPDIPLPAVLRGENDLRSRPWSKAFRIMHERMMREYAYGDYKAVNWDSLYQETAAAIIEAQETRDREGWYRAVRTYLHAIPDGNLNIDMRDTLRDAEAGASAGLALTRLSDGSVIVCGLIEEGPASEAGIAWGATILTWQGQPIDEALANTSTLWADNPPATDSMQRLQQLAWLPRGAEGESREFTYMNPGDDAPKSATVALASDSYETLTLSRPAWAPVDLFGSPVETEPLSGDYRYVRVVAIAPTLSTPFPVREFKSAVRLAVKEEAPGLVLDLRNVQGGDATLVSKMLSCLVTEEAFFATPSVWDSELETYLVETENTIMVVPEEPVYTGPVVVLVDAYTMGPAESLAGFLKGRENVKVFGTDGTAGSPGVPSVDLTLPGNYTVMYPDQRLLSESGEIQWVSGPDYAGGVLPDEVFEVDRTRAAAIYQAGEDVVLAGAIERLDSSTWRFP